MKTVTVSVTVSMTVRGRGGPAFGCFMVVYSVRYMMVYIVKLGRRMIGGQGRSG